MSDFWPHGKAAQRYGVLRPEGTSERAIFVIDKYGFIRFSTVYDIDKQPENEEIFAVLRRLEPQLSARPLILSSPPAASLPRGGIVLYCTSWCPECRRVRTWLKSHNLPYQEVDIDANPAGALQVKQWANGTRTTPIIDVDGTIVIRFDEARLTQLLLS